MNVLHLIAQDSFIMTSKRCIELYGLYEANIIGLFASISNYTEQTDPSADGWFYVTYERIEKELKLSDYIAKKPIDNLIKLGVLLEKREGIPFRKYFKFDKQKLLDSLLPSFSVTRNLENGRQDTEKLGDKIPSNSVTSSGESQLQDTEKLGINNNTNKNINNNTNKNINNITNKNLKKDEVIILFFETGWKNWKSYKMSKGDLQKAKKNFEKIVSDKSNPVHPMHLVLAMESYCTYCADNDIKTSHVATFLNGPHLEYLEKVAEELEAEEKLIKVETEEKEKTKELNNDPFWINAKEMLLKSPEIPLNWKNAALQGSKYFGIDIEGSHIVSVNSKFFRDWISREYKNIFDKIFGKWNIIYVKDE